MIETDRLILKPLSYNELIKHIKSPAELADDLKLQPSTSLLDKETQDAIFNDLLPNLTDLSKESLFYTMWIVIEKNKKAIIGGLCFHGAPNPIGEVEIGYGIDDEYRNNGYMTEALKGLIRWSKTRNDIKTIIALTEASNLSSIRILRKNNFNISIQEQNMLTLRLELV